MAAAVTEGAKEDRCKKWVESNCAINCNPSQEKNVILPFPALEVRRSVDLPRWLVVLIESSLER